MKKREIFIVIVLITFGMMYNLYDSGEVDLFFFEECSINPKRLLDKDHPVLFPGEETRSADVKYIDIDNAAGEIIVKKSADSTVVIKPFIRVYHKDKEKAEKIRRKINIRTAEVDGRVEIAVEPKRKFPYKRVRVRFELAVPGDVELKFYNSYGDIEITGIGGGNITLNERHGDVLVKDVAAPLDIHSRHGQVSLANIAAPVDLYAQHGKTVIRDIDSLKLNIAHSKVSIAGVKNECDINYAAHCTLEVEDSGRLNIEGRHTDIKLENIRDGVSIEDSHSRVNMKAISGDVKIKTRNCRIRLSDVLSDNLIIKNSHGSVDIEDISGKDLDIAVGNGDLDIRFIKVEGRINIRNRHSDIDLTYPETVTPAFNISAKYGKMINRTEADL
ncbi:MAG: DUF4097 family beta strand repeat protein, partial [Candidatus Aminicenantes bacterium]|nr:DUF4097 family beta strand repeat protein [Candidatus Aminicenantes bacterium]